MIDLVAIGRRFLELQVLGSGLHGIHQIVEDRRVFPLQKHGRVADVLLVLLGRNVFNTRCRAAVNLVLQARPGAIPEKAFTTVSYAENLL